MLQDYCKDNGWELVEIYCDEDFSGAGTYRPDFERLIKDCENGLIDIVLCKSQARFTRDMEIIEGIMHTKFIEWNIRFIGIVDHVDTHNKGNKKSRQINGLVNEWYVEDLSENIKKTFKTKKEQGQYIGVCAPYGYKKDPNNKHQLIIDEIPAKVVEEIYQLYYGGLGTYKIAESLNNKNILPPYHYHKSQGSTLYLKTAENQKKWTTHTVRKILKSRVYIGCLEQGRSATISYKNQKKKQLPEEEWIIRENTHEPIIDKEIWLTISSRFNERKKPLRSGDIHFLSQKVYCKTCSSTFVRDRSILKNGVSYYRLCRSKKQPNSSCDNKSPIKEIELNALLLQEINNIITNNIDEDLIQEEYQKKNFVSSIASKIQTLESEKIKLEGAKCQNEQKFTKIYNHLLNETITTEEFAIMKKSLTEENETLNNRLKTLAKEIIYLQEKQEKSDNKKLLLNKYKKIDELDRAIMNDFIDKIIVGALDPITKTREIEINWAF